MKVTVSFGSVRVLVPCGTGDLLVRDLIREATLRYKKAIGVSAETWVGVRSLRASSGGILDPDDRVRDVADDRESLAAECPRPPHAAPPAPRAHAAADGASGSSAGTASPDIFRGGCIVGGSMRVPNTDSCVEVGEADLEDGASGLQVRRGSEPSLHQDGLPPKVQVCEQSKRWSAAVVCREDSSRPPPAPPASSAHTFHRHTNRLSMQFSGQGSGVWMDAAERVSGHGSKSLPRDARREPLGQDMAANEQNNRVEDMVRWVSGVNTATRDRPLELLPEVGSTERAISGAEVAVSPGASQTTAGATETFTVSLVKGEKGLGFTITTRDNPTTGHCPIYIKNILPKGAAVLDGRLRAGDRLVSVNGAGAAGLAQHQVVALLRATPPGSTVTLVLERPASTKGNAQNVPEKPMAATIKDTPSLVNGRKSPENGKVSSLINTFNQNSCNNSVRGRIPKSSSKDDLLNRSQSSDKIPNEQLNSSSNSVLSVRNKLVLRLEVPVHDSEKAGLGISVKGKVTVGSEPRDLGIFIKSVLHGGAASRDGRLHTNDQLLSVNGVSLVGMSNAAAMEALRRALLRPPAAARAITLTIARRTADQQSLDSLARWKDDTPPNGNETTNLSSENSNTYNTVIYAGGDKENRSYETDSRNASRNQYDHSTRGSKKFASIVNINNNSWISNQSDDSKGYLERDSSQENKRDSFEWSRLDGWNPVIDRLTGLRNESYYMATQTEAPVVNGHNYRHNLGHVHLARSPPAHHNVIIEEDYGTTRSSACGNVANGGESGSDSGAGFSRDAIGRRSMSEKRHAALDAKATHTYKRIKEIKAVHSLQVGPGLGMRKSSSLESLQTAIQETQRLPRNEPIYARAHPPLKHWLTEEGRAPEGIVRGSPHQSSLSHKKPSLLKSLSTMFRLSKPHKKPESEVYGRSGDRASGRSPPSNRALPSRTMENEQPTYRNSARQVNGERRTPHHGPDTHMMESAWGPAGHYANFEEIQQNLNARREKLSEVQIGQMRRQVHAQRAKADEHRLRASACGSGSGRRPQSNYYEYDSGEQRRLASADRYH